MNTKYQKIISILGRKKVKLNEPLSEYTTFRIGGPADLFFVAEEKNELVRAINVAKKLEVPYFILGGGSNVLVGDKGYRGMVIKCQMLNVKFQKLEGKFIVLAEAGVSVKVLLNKLSKNSLTGLEFMAGIPGTVGGAVVGNAGAWQECIGDKVLRVKILTEEGKIRWLYQKQCGFAYRTSRFKRGKEIVLEVKLELKQGEPHEIMRKIKLNLEKRSSLPVEPSAGCVFVNPKPKAAGKLIEECGLKGFKIGGAQISAKHANFIINQGNAKAEDILRLIEIVKQKVKEKFNIDLKEEIVKIGEF